MASTGPWTGVATAPSPAIDVRALSKRYGDRVAVDAVSLRVAAREVVALVGPNGAGKTTTFRLLAGLIAATAGHGHVAGVQLDGADRWRLRGRVGLLTEAPGLWERLSVRANLLTYARLHGVAAPEAHVAGLLERVDLSDRAGDHAGTLSKGLRQRVALARALVGDPPVLLLDEPTSGLDPAAARLVRQVVDDARRRGAAVILATHRLDEAAMLADRVAVLRRTLLADDTPDALRARLGGPARVTIEVEGAAERWAAVAAAEAAGVRVENGRLDVTLRPDRSAADMVAALVGAGARLNEVRRHEPTLEDVYLALVQRDD